jgi:hypothetical protein
MLRKRTKHIAAKSNVTPCSKIDANVATPLLKLPVFLP